MATEPIAVDATHAGRNLNDRPAHLFLRLSYRGDRVRLGRCFHLPSLSFGLGSVSLFGGQSTFIPRTTYRYPWIHLKNLPRKTITLTRRTLLVVVAIAAVAVLVSAAMLANYIVPTNSFRVTGSPGLTAYDTSGAAVTSISWGDIQQGAAPQTFQLSLRNTGGNFALYIIDTSTRNTATNVFDTVSSLNPSGLPSGVHLSWNYASLTGGGGQPFTCTFNGQTYSPCMSIGQGSGTAVITLSLSADSSATPTATSQNFVLEFDSFQTPTG